MLRCLIFMILFIFSVVARADFGVNPCTFGPVTASVDITSDLSLANVGDVIGSYTVEGSLTQCNNNGAGARRLHIAIAEQPVDPLSPGNIRRCQMTVSGVAFERGDTFGGCSRIGNSISFGPLIETIEPLNGTFPKSFSRSFDIVKTGNIPAGPHLFRPVNSSLALSAVTATANVFEQAEFGTIPPGEIIGTTCSLATTLIPVDFGDAALGDSESFTISFDSCTDQQDAVAYNNAVSLEFSSGQAIQPDGSALQNCQAADCAKGIQIELQDGNGSPINLMTPYKLTTNNPVIGANGLDYTFNAQLQANPGEPLGGGKIDTQLVFNTIVE